MLRILLAAVVIAVGLFIVKDGRLIERAGLTGSCAAISTPRGQSGYWHACRAGRIEGAPDLSRKSCTSQGVTGELERWRCPTPVATSPIR